MSGASGPSILVTGRATRGADSYALNTVLGGSPASFSGTTSASEGLGSLYGVTQDYSANGDSVTITDSRIKEGNSQQVTLESNDGSFSGVVTSRDSGSIIQDMINFAEPSDIIDLGAGIYNENVLIGKSLIINGAGADSTIVDGDVNGDGAGDGSVFTIGSDTNRNLGVTLSSMTIQHGSGTYSEPDGGYIGGGILNFGTLNMDHVRVSSNIADYGGGVYNHFGTITLNEGSAISRNTATTYGGGIYTEKGIVNMNQGSIIGGTTSKDANTAIDGGGFFGCHGGVISMYGDSSVINNKASKGGGIYLLDGTQLNMYDHSSIANNKASYDGGGIYSYGGQVNMFKDSSISGNMANQCGGGIWNSIINMYGGSITGNTAGDLGGGIYQILSSNQINMYAGSSIANNNAGGGGGIWKTIPSTLTFKEALIDPSPGDWGGATVAYWPGYDTINDPFGFFHTSIEPHNTRNDGTIDDITEG